MEYKVCDLLELRVDKKFYTTGNPWVDIQCHKEDMFIIVSKDETDDREFEYYWTLYHQKSTKTMPEFTDDFIDELFRRID